MSAAFSWERTPYGRGAWLVRFADRPGDVAFERGRAIDHYLELHAPAGVAWVVAFTSVLLEIESADVAIDPLLAALSTAAAPPPGPSHEIPVVYDGEDLPALAASCGLTPADVARLHAEPEYRVYALGFSPGFPYLGELDPRLHAPRRATPRERVPAGSVAIGGEHTGIYPLEGPGGWSLLGRTPSAILDTGKSGEDAFLLRAGDRVRFVAVGDAPRLPAPAPAASSVGAEDAAVEIVAAGIANWIRDAPRPARFRRFGVPPGGAMNPVAAARANALVGNPSHAPLLEVLIGGLEIQACRAIDIAITSRNSHGERRTLARGERARVRTSHDGLWCYLAIAGGVAAERRFGSASHGPRKAWGPLLARGVRLGAGSAAASAPAEAIPERTGSGSPLRIWRGPQWDRFDARAREQFLSSEWTVTRAIDRIGYRLAGPVLASPPMSLASEPVRTGTVQVPPDGQPIAIMPDGPTIGGYAKIAWIEPDDLARLAETRPSHTVRFRLTEDG